MWSASTLEQGQYLHQSRNHSYPSSHPQHNQLRTQCFIQHILSLVFSPVSFFYVFIYNVDNETDKYKENSRNPIQCRCSSRSRKFFICWAMLLDGLGSLLIQSIVYFFDEETFYTAVIECNQFAVHNFVTFIYAFSDVWRCLFCV